MTVSGGISVISGNITVTSGGVISSGDVTTRNIFLGGGTVTAVSGSNLVLTSSSGSVILDAAGTAGNVIVSDSKLQLGTSGAVNLTASSSGALLLNASTIAMSSQSSLTLGTSNSLFTGSDGSLVISNNGGIPNGSGGSIGSGIYISTGSLTIPEETPILFGNPNTNIYSHGDRLYINGYKGTIINGDDITFLGNLNIAGNIQSGTTVDLSSPYIYPLGNYNVVDISNVTQPTIGILEITTATHNNLVVTDRVMLKSTYSDPRIDETYFVSSIVSPTIFRVTTGTVLITGSSTGRIVSDLVEDPQKDVGIQVNWHTGATIGTAAYQTGFFGFKRSTERWTFYNLGKNTNDVFSGTLGNIEAAKVFTNRMSGFVLDGPVTAGSNTIAGTAFQIGGGSIENTPIGINSANLGRFTTLTSTVQTNVNNQSISGRLSYSTERFTVSSATASINPSALVMVSFVSVIGISFNGSGIMPNGTVDGQTKTIIISAMGANCTYTLNFTAGKLVMPNPINPSAVPTKITFKRKGQSLNLVWDNTAEFWVPTGGNGGYVS